MKILAEFVKGCRNEAKEEFAERTGVTLTVIRKIEQDPTNLNLYKAQVVTMMFGHKLVPVLVKT